MIILNHLSKSTLSDVDVFKLNINSNNLRFHQANCLQIVFINDEILIRIELQFLK